MRTLRNSVAFVAVLAAVVIAHPMALAAASSAFVNGRVFESYFGWLSWPPVIFASVSAAIFFIAGALLSRLIVSRYAIGWAFALGLLYTVIRAYFSRSLTSERELGEAFWVGVELVLPVLAACLGAFAFGRHPEQPQNDAKAA